MGRDVGYGGGLLGAYSPLGTRALTGLLAHRPLGGAAGGVLGDALARGGGPIAVPLAGALLLEPPPVVR